MSEEILAVSAGHEITEKELAMLIATYPPEQQMYLKAPEVKDQLVDQLVEYYLFAKSGEDQNFEETKEYKLAMERAKAESLSQLAIANLLKDITVSEEEERAFYEENKSQFMEGGQVRAKHILVEEEEEANKIAEEIAAGKTFEDAAREYSKCPSKDQGGDLGSFGRGQMVTEFENAAFEGEIGKVIGPVQTKFGYHLILVDERTDATKKAFEEVQEQVHGAAVSNKQKEIYAKKVQELKEAYGVTRN